MLIALYLILYFLFLIILLLNFSSDFIKFRAFYYLNVILLNFVLNYFCFSLSYFCELSLINQIFLKILFGYLNKISFFVCDINQWIIRIFTSLCWENILLFIVIWRVLNGMNSITFIIANIFSQRYCNCIVSIFPFCQSS